ncbi:MAG: cytochrome c oxidase subunit II [Salinarimonas sp.]
MAPLTVPLGLAGCDGGLSALAPAGPVAADIAWLWWALFAGATFLTLFVLVLLALAFGPPRAVSERRWTHGLGLWFSLGVLTTVLGTGLWVGERILPREDDAIEVHAHAYQWGWRFTQPGPDGPIETEGVLHIPAAQPVDVLVTTEDVIHAFWVPRLAGKIDAIPGRTNRLRLQADTPGTLSGTCAEFCGIGHAGMRFEVIVHEADGWPASVALATGGGDD